MPPAKTKPVSLNALEQFEATFAKRHGATTLRNAGAHPVKYDVIPTGSLALDIAMGCGGYVRGRITEIWGPESVGKTTLCLLAAREAQRLHPDKVVGFVDMEQTLDTDYAKVLGVELDRLYHVQPDSAEEVADIVKDLASAVDGKGQAIFSILFVDSVGNMTPEEEFEKDAGDATVGTTAKIVTRMVKIASVNLRKNNVALVIVNQVRAIIGPRGGSTTGGGFALKHVTTHKLKVARTAGQPRTIGSGDNAVQVGLEIAVKVEKNKVGPPKRVATIVLMNSPTEKWGPAGVDGRAEALAVGKATGVIPMRPGGYYMLPDGTEVRGENLVNQAFDAKPELVAEVRRLALLSLSGEPKGEASEDIDEAQEG